MTFERSGLGRSILAAGRDALSLADVCARHDRVPPSILAFVLWRFKEAGLLRLECRPDERLTLETTALGLEVLGEIEEPTGP